MSNLLTGYQSASELAHYFTNSISRHYILSGLKSALKSQGDTFPYFLAGCGFTAKKCHRALGGEDPEAERLADLIRSYSFMCKISQSDPTSEFDAFILGLGLNREVDINLPRELVLRNSRHSDTFNHGLCNFEEIDSQNKAEDFASFLAGAGFQKNKSEGTSHDELPLALNAFLKQRETIEGFTENFLAGYDWCQEQCS